MKIEWRHFACGNVYKHWCLTECVWKWVQEQSRAFKRFIRENIEILLNKTITLKSNYIYRN